MHLRCSRTGKGKYMYLFDVKQHNYSFTLIIDNNFLLHTVTSITTLLIMHKQASRSWKLRSWSPSTVVVYVKVNSLLKVSHAIIYIYPFPWPPNYLLLLSIPTDPLSPQLNLQILLTGLHTFSNSTSANSFFLVTFMFGDQFLNSSDFKLKHCYCREILITWASRENALFYCADNTTYNYYYGILGE